MEKIFFIHVGPHKCGNRFLKNDFFPNLRGIYDLNTKDIGCTFITLEAMLENPFFFDPEKIRERILKRLEKVEEEKILMADPEIFGAYLRMVEPGRYYSKQFFDSYHNANTLKKIFPNARIIITPRRQDTWIESAYKTTFRRLKSVEIDEFLNPQDDRSKGQVWGYEHLSTKPCCDIGSLDWNPYIENYYDLFGQENVLVMPYEMINNDLEAFLGRYSAFLGVEPYYPETVRYGHRSYSELSCKLSYALNRFIHTAYNPCGIIPNRPFIGYLLKRRNRNLFFKILCGISFRLSLPWFLTNVIDRHFYKSPNFLGEKRRQEILDHFRESNRKLSDLTGMDFGKYGYY